MKIVIGGIGRTGRYLAKILQKEKHDLVLIEEGASGFRTAQERFDAQIERGDVADPMVLEPVIDESVDYFIAMTPDDGANIISTLIARRFGAKRVIARISDPNKLIHPLLTDDPQVSLLNAEMIVSKDLGRLVGTPSADEVEFFAKGKAEMATIPLSKESTIIGKKLSDMDVPKSWLVAAVVRRGEFTIASGETAFENGDHVVVVGDPADYDDMEVFLGVKTVKIKRVILAGYNTVSAKLSGALRKKGIEVRMIEEDREKAQIAASELDDVLVLHGDATDEDILVQAGVSDCNYLLALTDDDETNVLISLLAKEKGVARVVALTQKPQYKQVIQKIGIDAVVNPRSSLVNGVIRLMHHKDLLGINLLEGGQGRMMEFEVTTKGKLVGKPLSKVKLPKQILIGAIIRKDDLIIPRGNTKIQVGDHVVVFSTLSVLAEVKKLFGH